jgi:septation ring formation regulator EzrA
MYSFECRKILDRVKYQLKQVNYNPDLQKIYKNLEEMVTNISKIEVDCRRTKNSNMLEKPLQEFNDSVDRLEKLILLAKLLD